MGSDEYDLKKGLARWVSIHAPRVGSDQPRTLDIHQAPCFNPRPPSGERLQSASDKKAVELFQSTPPEWGATVCPRAYSSESVVSIHAPRVGSDSACIFASSHFIVSIHAPRVGSDPQGAQGVTGNYYVSIHAPRVGSDVALMVRCYGPASFNPRPPSGERLAPLGMFMGYYGFNPRPPSGERHE